jgi:SAM-dependent methyltransferase
MSDAQEFYDGFAETYRFIFADWQQSDHRQAEIISKFLLGFGKSAPATVLDCTCGIGTQAIGLAMKGYQVHATDLSPKSIERAKEYAASFDLAQPIHFDVADLLHTPKHPTQFDIVLAFDNPIAHFHSDADLRRAFQTMALQLNDGGLLSTSLRDYDTLAQEKPRQSHISVSDDENGRRIMFQVWDWQDDGSHYDSEMFVITQNGNQWQTQSHKAKFRAWQRADVSRILVEAGLSEIEWQMPEQSGFYQPIVSARK